MEIYNATFKERHLVVIAQKFAQSLGGSWGSGNMNLMSFIHADVAIHYTSKSAGNCYLITLVLFEISKFFE